MDIPSDRFLLRRRDVQETGSHAYSTVSLAETLDRLVPAYFVDRDILEQSLRNGELVNTPYCQYYAINSDYDRQFGQP